MADSVARRSALAEVCRAGRYGAQTTQPGIVLCERADLTLIDLRGNPRHGEFLASAQAALGCALPLAPNTSATTLDGSVLWLGPDEWLIVGNHGKPAETLQIAGGFLTDVGHGRAATRISGPRTRELLAKGCSLDLHPRVFQAGQCAQTSIAKANVLVHRPDAAGGFDVYCARSYAGHLWHWLTEAAAEYGYEVLPPA